MFHQYTYLLWCEIWTCLPILLCSLQRLPTNKTPNRTRYYILFLVSIVSISPPPYPQQQQESNAESTTIQLHVLCRIIHTAQQSAVSSHLIRRHFRILFFKSKDCYYSIVDLPIKIQLFHKVIKYKDFRHSHPWYVEQYRGNLWISSIPPIRLASWLSRLSKDWKHNQIRVCIHLYHRIGSNHMA